MPTTKDKSETVFEKIELEASQLDAPALAKLIKRLSEYMSGLHLELRSRHETELLYRINNGISDSHWRTYKTLNRKRRTEILTDAELEELRQLSNTIELAHADRLNALVELSQLRGVSVNKLMKEFGIRKRRNG